MLRSLGFEQATGVGSILDNDGTTMAKSLVYVLKGSLVDTVTSTAIKNHSTKVPLGMHSVQKLPDCSIHNSDFHSQPDHRVTQLLK